MQRTHYAAVTQHHSTSLHSHTSIHNILLLSSSSAHLQTTFTRLTITRHRRRQTNTRWTTTYTPLSINQQHIYNVQITTTILMMIINKRTTSGDCERCDIEHVAQYLRLGRRRVAHHQHLHVAWLPPRCQAHRSLTLMSPRMCVPLSRFFSHPPYASVPLMQWIVCWLSYQ